MSGFVQPGFKAAALALCALVFCAEFSGGFLQDGANALRTVKAKASCSGETCTTSKKKGVGTTGVAYPEDTVVPSNFDVQAELVSAAAAQRSTSGSGVFRVDCAAGGIGHEDPVAYSGQPGKSHLQQFFGNGSATAYSTYASLRSAGASTCMSRVDRSFYSLPAMLDGRGNAVRPDVVNLTFTRRSSRDAKCQPAAGQPGGCIPFPNGLRFIFGYDDSNPTAGAGNPHFTCEGPTAPSGKFDTILEAAANCTGEASAGVYNRLVASIDAPSCWDGKNLDSTDHRSHMAYPVDGWLSSPQCPSTHPFQIPALTISAHYTVDTSIGNWRFSSDETTLGARPGTTFRATWFGAWDNKIMSMWVANCMDRLLNCTNGNLGNGYRIRPSAGFVTTANPRLVPIPGPTPTSTPSPTPAPSPSPTPTPTPSPGGGIGLASEGDSISVTWGGNHTGIFAKNHPGLKHCGLAVGGSSIGTVTARADGVVACNPKVLTILIGANDMYNWNPAVTTAIWLNKVWAYTDSMRAKGYLVAMGTILPQYNSTNAAWTAEFNRRRNQEANPGIRAAVGVHVDAVIDFAKDPVMGPDSAAQNKQLYYDGLHPTDGCGMGCGGQGKLAVIYTPVVDRLLAQ